MAHESAWIERLTGDPYEPFGRRVPASDRWSYSTASGIATFPAPLGATAAAIPWRAYHSCHST